MEISTRICDICFEKGLVPEDFWREYEEVHYCGELGDFCDTHYVEAHNLIMNHYFVLNPEPEPEQFLEPEPEQSPASPVKGEKLVLNI